MPLPLRPLVRDRATDRVGEIVDMDLNRVFTGRVTIVHLRPVGGGIEWTTSPDQIEKIGDSRTAPTVGGPGGRD